MTLKFSHRPLSSTNKLTDSATFIISSNDLPRYISKTVNPTFDIHLTILRNLAGSTLAFITCKDYEDGSVDMDVTPCNWPSNLEYSINASKGTAYIDGKHYWWSDNQFFYEDNLDGEIMKPIGVFTRDNEKTTLNLLNTLPETIKQLGILLHISSSIYNSRKAGIGRPLIWPSLRQNKKVGPPQSQSTEQVADA